MDATQLAVLCSVVAARLVVPLFIPRYPLPAVLAALVIDGLDQTLFQAAGVSAVLARYQYYDKALDVYYLVIAYTATIRNWQDDTAFRVGQVLWYWRLAGAVAFELSGWQPVLLIFPNTFEYFFIAYEAVRTRWRPDRLTGRHLVLLAAAIWILIKLPQEWWIHVARLDATSEIAAHPLAAALLFGGAGAVLLVAGVRLAPRVPRPDRPFTVDADARRAARVADVRPAGRRTWLWTTAEKVLLTGAVLTIFAHLLPTSAGPGTVAVAVCTVAAANAGISEGLEALQRMPARIPARFALMLVINTAVYEVIHVVRGRVVVDRVTVSVFLLLLSLIITLYDQFRGLRYGTAIRSPGAATTTAVPGAS